MGPRTSHRRNQQCRRRRSARGKRTGDVFVESKNYERLVSVTFRLLLERDRESRFVLTHTLSLFNRVTTLLSMRHEWLGSVCAWPDFLPGRRLCRKSK